MQITYEVTSESGQLMPRNLKFKKCINGKIIESGQWPGSLKRLPEQEAAKKQWKIRWILHVFKEVEVQEFKSFTDKTRVIFDQGVTTWLALMDLNQRTESTVGLRGIKCQEPAWRQGARRILQERKLVNPLNYACVTVVLDNRDGFIKHAVKEIRK